MAKRKQLSTNDLPPKSKGRFNFDLDGAPTGKSLCYSRLSLLSHTRVQQLYISIRFTTSRVPNDRCNSSLPRRSYWHRPGRAFRLLADFVTIFKNTALCLLASSFNCIHY